MSKLIIVALVAVWAVVLLPDVLKRLSNTRRGDSIRSFSDALSSLGRSRPGSPRASNVIDLRSRTRALDGVPEGAAVVRRAPRPATPRTRVTRPPGARPVSHGAPAHVRKRRQEVVVCLGCAVLLTLLATVAFGGPFLYLHLLVDLLLVAYLLLLAQVTGMSVVPAPTSVRHQALAPLSPLEGLRTGTVGEATPYVEPTRLAN